MEWYQAISPTILVFSIVHSYFFRSISRRFGNFATDLFVEKFSCSTVEAGRITSVPAWAAVATIIPAGMIDYYGQRATMLIVGSTGF